MAVIATQAFIRRGDASTTLDLAARLLTDREPLMHKAVGWMLREVGSRVDRALLTGFLDAHAGADAAHHAQLRHRAPGVWGARALPWPAALIRRSRAAGPFWDSLWVSQN